MFYRGVITLEGNEGIEFRALKKFVKFTETEEMPKSSDYCKFKLIKLVELFPAVKRMNAFMDSLYSIQEK
jgi:hypothetical protein